MANIQVKFCPLRPNA